MKVLTLFLFSFFLLSAKAAKPCKVYGISDSPQGLHCRFPNQHIVLNCHRGRYFLNDSPVSVAFHLEVESGTVPLVFKSPDMTMTVTLDRPIVAELQTQKTEITGTCTLIP